MLPVIEIIYHITTFTENMKQSSLKDFVIYIKPGCLNAWYNLGVLLDVPVQKLEDIRLSEQDDPDLCCVKMFTKWLENGTDTTWSTLLKSNYFLNTKTKKLHGKGRVII